MVYGFTEVLLFMVHNGYQTFKTLHYIYLYIHWIIKLFKFRMTFPLSYQTILVTDNFTLCCQMFSVTNNIHLSYLMISVTDDSSNELSVDLLCW